MTRQTQNAHKPYFRWLLLGAAVVAGYVIIPQLKNFHTSFDTMRQSHLGWVGVALVAALATYLCAAGLYMLLATKRLRFWRTLTVQFAGNFSNRLLPAGIGALGVGFDFLRRQGHSKTTAISVLATNNVLGYVGHALLFALLVVLTRPELKPVHLTHASLRVILVVGLLTMIVIVALLRTYGQRLTRAGKELTKLLRTYRQQPSRIIGALLCSMALTACYVLCLYACTQGIDLGLSFVTIFIVMTLGVLGGTVTPTPGGLGGAEAGIVAGLTLYGTTANEALAVALLYRLFTFWLPLVFGSVAFVIAGKRHYI